MFTYNLKEKEKKDIAVYGPSKLLKAICGIFALFILIGFFIALSEEGWQSRDILPLIICFLLLLVALYRDEWIISNRDKAFISIWGFGPFVKKDYYKYDDIRRIELTHFVKGIHASMEQKSTLTHKAYCVLSIKMKGEEEEKHDIEIIPEKSSAGKIERLAPLMAAYAGLEYFVDRPREVKVDIKRVF